MKISMKTDYALRALFTLVEHDGKAPVSVAELARRNDVPKRFLEQIMLKMKAKGWVASEMGKQGGYVLAKSPDDITAGQVVRCFDGVLSPIGCVSKECYEPCSQETTCRFRRLFLDIRNFSARLLEHSTLASIYQGKPVTQDEVLTMEFIGGAGI